MHGHLCSDGMYVERLMYRKTVGALELCPITQSIKELEVYVVIQILTSYF